MDERNRQRQLIGNVLGILVGRDIPTADMKPIEDIRNLFLSPSLEEPAVPLREIEAQT